MYDLYPQRQKLRVHELHIPCETLPTCSTKKIRSAANWNFYSRASSGWKKKERKKEKWTLTRYMGQHATTTMKTEYHDWPVPIAAHWISPPRTQFSESIPWSNSCKKRISHDNLSTSTSECSISTRWKKQEICNHLLLPTVKMFQFCAPVFHQRLRTSL